MNGGSKNQRTNEFPRRPVDQSLLVSFSSADGTNGSEKRRQFLEDFNGEHTATYGVMNLIAASDPRLIEKAGAGQFKLPNQNAPSCVYLG